MKGIVLVGGFGTRLRPLTCNVPKVMTPVLNEPLLKHVLSNLAKHDIRDIVLTEGHLGQVMRERFGDGSELGLRLTYVKEDKPLGTAGGVKNAEPYLGSDPFYVFNGDMLTGIDLTEMLRGHRHAKPKVTIALTPVDNPTIYGVVETGTQGMVTRFVEKPSWDKVTTNMINAGIYILEPDVLKHVPAGAPSMFEDFLFPKLLELGEPILAFPSDAYWIDLGSPEKYLKANYDLLLQRGNEVFLEGESHIHPDAQLVPPVLIGEGCAIGAGARIAGPTILGPRCTIGEAVTVERSVLWDGVQVWSGAWLQASAVGSGSRVEENCQLVECIIGDEVVVGRGTREWGSKIPPHSFVAPRVETAGTRPTAPLPPSHLCTT